MAGTRKKFELGETCKSVILSKALFDVLGYRKELDIKAIKKGLEIEDEAIQAVSMLKAVQLTKNSERRSNDWFTGECDLLTNDGIRDIKCSWSIDTHPWLHDDAERKAVKAGYDWQGLVYMDLWGKEKHSVDFVLLPTPEHLLGFGDDPLGHIDTVLNIPLQKRIRSIDINFCQKRLDEAKEKVESDLVQDYYQEVCEQLML